MNVNWAESRWQRRPGAGCWQCSISWKGLYWWVHQRGITKLVIIVIDVADSLKWLACSFSISSYMIIYQQIFKNYLFCNLVHRILITAKCYPLPAARTAHLPFSKYGSSLNFWSKWTIYIFSCIFFFTWIGVQIV